jgi:hypothetical protein
MREAVKKGTLTSRDKAGLIDEAREKEVLTAEEAAMFQQVEALRREIIAVDDFAQLGKGVG